MVKKSNLLNRPDRPSLAAMLTLEEAQAMRPEWLRIPLAVRICGMSRTRLFDLIAQGEIDSRHIKKPGCAKGIRLIRLSSLLAYIDGAAK
jgi:hypothetical protein